MIEDLSYLTGVEELRPPYLQPSALVRAKQLDRLDAHCSRFIARAPLVSVRDIEARIEADARDNLY